MPTDLNNSTIALFGLPIANVSMEEAVNRISENIESGTLHQIATANLDFARNARKSRLLHRIICDCSLVLPDGNPMLWASRLMGKPLKQRVTGVDLIPELARLSAERGYGIFLLGSDEKNARTAAEVLARMHPGVKIVGRYSPPVKALDQMDNADILRRITDAAPDILLVAFGNPKQEIWIAQNRDQLNVPVAIGIGGSLDMISGSVTRAPRIFQKLQLEWLFRMAQEPRRLFPRYFRDLRALLIDLPIEAVMSKIQPASENDWPLAVTLQGKNRILQVSEVLTGDDCDVITSQAKLAARLGQTLIFDLTLTSRIEADGIGCMLEARRVMLAAGLPVWLTQVSAPVRRVLQSAGLFQVFRIAGTADEAIKLSGMALPHPERRKGKRVISGAARPMMEEKRSVA